MSEAIDALCMACNDEGCYFQPAQFQRRPLGDYDVLIDMKYCGVCHTDLHVAANHMKLLAPSTYPCTPGHELAGVCTGVGAKVTKVKIGDHVGVGCMVDSCLSCKSCKAGEEQQCPKQVGTYQGKDWSGRAATFPAGLKTVGGYSTKMVVTERFAILIPQDYPLQMAGPVMCAGITMYEPLKKHGATIGTRVGIVGLGGLGVMGIKIAKAMGCKVTGISRTTSKKEFALKCGADDYIASTSANELESCAGSLDIVINTIPVYHDYGVYTKLLVSTGKQVLLGLHTGSIAALITNGLFMGRSNVTFSVIGGITNTQEVIDLCAKHDIKPEVEIKNVEDLSQIYEALDSANDSGVRYVLDIEGSLTDKSFDRCRSMIQPNLKPLENTITIAGIISEVASLVWRQTPRFGKAVAFGSVALGVACTVHFCAV